MKRNMYGIPVPSHPIPLSTERVELTPDQLLEAEFEASAEAELFRKQEDEYSDMYNYI